MSRKVWVVAVLCRLNYVSSSRNVFQIGRTTEPSPGENIGSYNLMRYTVTYTAADNGSSLYNM